jgi:hypothetical protein
MAVQPDPEGGSPKKKIWCVSSVFCFQYFVAVRVLYPIKIGLGDISVENPWESRKSNLMNFGITQGV